MASIFVKLLHLFVGENLQGRSHSLDVYRFCTHKKCIKMGNMKILPFDVHT